ncbi:homeobox-leucine zipper protein HOX11-like [Arachis stenosperma]|uniref:homeobox-leucine zipper protein HOX11-like n=1 Tax=Arachis stenosperma TaxID=217475 RepID=UPI0025ACB7C3|nr:homeobox-leucine zipper protein HOX11-like [Arachis stenosperma]
MELALSLGEAPKSFTLLDNTPKLPNNKDPVGFCIALGAAASSAGKSSEEDRRGSSDPPVQLDLLPSTPVLRSQHPSSHLRIPWLNDALGLERVTSEAPAARALDVNSFPVAPAAGEDGDDGAALSSPNSAVSSFQMDFCLRNGNGGNGGDGAAAMMRNRRDVEGGEGNDRGTSDDDENGSTRKKLRLSKEQSAFLEESFKEHTTLNPKQKLALAKQLNLRPRQVEVWFQNRRARTKLKQTEVDCEYLKRCCDTLTEENRRLQKELQELRALKTSQPFYMQLPATTLTMCPSCERVATNTAANNNDASQIASALSLSNKPRILPFPNTQAHPPPAQKAHQ